MSDFDDLKTLEDLFVCYLILSNLKNTCVSNSSKIYLGFCLESILSSFNLIFKDFERRLSNGS